METSRLNYQTANQTGNSENTHTPHRQRADTVIGRYLIRRHAMDQLGSQVNLELMDQIFIGENGPPSLRPLQSMTEHQYQLLIIVLLDCTLTLSQHNQQ